MSARRTDVFFYGLFMDPELLRRKGLTPGEAELGSVRGYTLRIGRRATLVPDASGKVHGSVASLTLAELERLYAEPGLEDYRPVAVLVDLAMGGVVAALCYTLPEPPAPGEFNPDYAGRLRTVARKVGLPGEYVAWLDSLAALQTEGREVTRVAEPEGS